VRQLRLQRLRVKRLKKIVLKLQYWTNRVMGGRKSEACEGIRKACDTSDGVRMVHYMGIIRRVNVKGVKASIFPRAWVVISQFDEVCRMLQYAVMEIDTSKLAHRGIAVIILLITRSQCA